MSYVHDEDLATTTFPGCCGENSAAASFLGALAYRATYRCRFCLSVYQADLSNNEEETNDAD